MASTIKTLKKLTMILQEEEAGCHKVFRSLCKDDSEGLCDQMSKAFKMTEENDCNALLIGVLDDEVFLSAEDAEKLYMVILGKSGWIKHSFGTTIFIETSELKMITFILHGGANSIASASQFMAVKVQVDLKTPKKRGGKKKASAAAVVPAVATRRSTRASKVVVKVEPASAPTRRGKKKPTTVVVLDSPIRSPTTAGLQEIDSRYGRGLSEADTVTPKEEIDLISSDSGDDTPPPLSSRKEIHIDSSSSDSDSDSNTSYHNYKDMGFTQEGQLGKQKTLDLVTKLMEEEQDAHCKEIEADKKELKKKCGKGWNKV